MTEQPSIAKLKTVIGTEQDIGDIPVIVSWEKINSEEPYWNVTIRGSNGSMRITDVRDITNYGRFVNQCFKQLNMIFPPVKQVAWANMLRDAMPKMTEKQADEDTTRKGQFREMLEQFLTNRIRGERREDLLRGVPWEDEESRQHYFSMRALASFLERERMKVDRKEIATWIRALGGEPQNLTIKNHRIRCWWVPSDAVDEAPELSPPNMPESPIA
jgi:hypothetical protein